MSGMMYRLCYDCGELVPWYVEIARERQYYEHFCRVKNRVINFAEEDRKKAKRA